MQVMLSHLAMKLYYVRLDTERLAAEEMELTKYYDDRGDDSGDDNDDSDDDSGDDSGDDDGIDESGDDDGIDDDNSDDDDSGNDDDSGDDDDAHFDDIFISARKVSTIKKELIALKSSGMDLASQRSPL